MPEQESDRIASAFFHGRPLEAYQRIPAARLQEYARRPDVQVLALSEVGVMPGIVAKRIPTSELGVRAAYELDRSRQVLIDCGTVFQASRCDDAAVALAKQGYRVIVAEVESR